MVPHSVKGMSLRQNQLNSIMEWKGLEGKSLGYLNVARNTDLILNLREFVSNQDSLKTVVVSRRQIDRCFRLRGTFGIDPSYNGLRKWVTQSSLDRLTVLNYQGGRVREFQVMSR